MSGYAGSSTLTNFPVLVKLSTTIEGFDYADFKGASGSDLRFVDSDGNELPCEIDTWDASGTSLVWVKIPALAASTVITAYYGNSSPAAALAATDVWSGYVGVWHFGSISSGVTPDSTANGLNMTAYVPASSTGRVDGVLGTCVLCAPATGSKSYGFQTASYAAFGVSNQVTVSGWVRHLTPSMNGYERVFSSKTSYTSSDGFEMENNNGSTTAWSARGSADTSIAVTTPNAQTAGWMQIELVYNGTTLTAYVNGAKNASGTVAKVVNNSNGFAIGNNAAKNETSFFGLFDEVRLARVSASADWAQAEYDTVKSASFAVAGTAVANDDTAPVFASAPTLVWNNGATERDFSATLSSGVGAVYAIITVDGNSYTSALSSGVVSPQTFIDTIPDLYFSAGDVVCTYAVWATNTLGSIGKKAGTNAFLNGAVSIAAGSDAAELDLATPGTFTVSRPAGALATKYDLAVTYTVADSSTAVSGTNFKALPGSVTIPAGAASATINVYPLREKTADHTLVLALTGDAYKISASSNSATITIRQLVAPVGTNTWIAAGASGDPSLADNWSLGTVPAATDHILVDGRFSQASLVWSNGLTETVASWTQSADYTGTVTIATLYPQIAGAAFTNFAVIGDVDLEGGTWTHPLSLTAGAVSAAQLEAQQKYRLRVTVGGTFTVGSAASVDVAGKGHKPNAGSLHPFHGGAYVGARSCYDDVKRPVDIGYGSSYFGGDNDWKLVPGGGAVSLTVAGAMTVNGKIAADGGARDDAAAGGSVLIEAASLSGSGSITAIGPAGARTDYSNAGVGGRIAVYTTTPVTLGSPVLSASVAAKSHPGGCGTVFLKDATMDKGVLSVVNLLNTGSVAVDVTTPVATNGDWSFDAVKLGGGVHLAIPSGSTLSLPNGLASITTSDTSPVAALWYLGGTLDLGSATTQTLAGNWVLTGVSNLTLNCDLDVKNGGAIGIRNCSQSVTSGADPALTLVSSEVTVMGNMTVESTAAGITAYFAGQYQSDNAVGAGFAYGGVHGGRRGTNTIGRAGTTYGSVFNPRLAGLAASSRSWRIGGGAVKVNVGETLTLDADAASDGDGSGETWAAGAPGSIDIVCGALVGSAKIHANGLQESGGGRVAVRLTKAGSTFDAFGVTNITAAGYGAASAGTVYLQTADEGGLAGTIRVRGKGASATYKVAGVTNNYATPIPGIGAHVDDAASFAKANLDVSGYGEAQFTTNLTLAAVTVEANSKLDLLGNAVTVTALEYDGKEVAAGVYPASSAAVSAFVIDSTTNTAAGSITVKGKVGGFVIRICDSNVIVPFRWSANHLAAAEDRATAAISAALGLDPDKADSVVLCGAGQGVSSASATLFARNVAPATTGVFSVS